MKKQESMVPKKRSRWKSNKYTFTEEDKIFGLMEKDFKLTSKHVQRTKSCHV